MSQVQTFEATITVADNGYFLDFGPAYVQNGVRPERASVIFNTGYMLGQWIDAHLPKPPGVRPTTTVAAVIDDALDSIQGDTE